MHLSQIYLLCFAASVAATPSADFSAFAASRGVPDCARACAPNPPPECNGDYKCMCQDEKLLNSAECCLINQCEEEDLAQTYKLVKRLCKHVGAPVEPKNRCVKSEH